MTSGRDKGDAGECVERNSSLWFVIMGLWNNGERYVEMRTIDPTYVVDETEEACGPFVHGYSRLHLSNSIR
jgi:hypothetical protein